MAPNGSNEAVVHSFVDALQSRNLEKALSLFSPDAVYVNANGEFRGGDEIRRYLKWMFDSNSDFKVRPSGIGMLVASDKVVFEHEISGTFRGAKWSLLMLCVYEFSAGKIRRLVTIFDRLAMAKQVAGGWMARRAVAAVIKGSEKGLH